MQSFSCCSMCSRLEQNDKHRDAAVHFARLIYSSATITFNHQRCIYLKLKIWVLWNTNAIYAISKTLELLVMRVPYGYEMFFFVTLFVISENNYTATSSGWFTRHHENPFKTMNDGNDSLKNNNIVKKIILAPLNTTLSHVWGIRIYIYWIYIKLYMFYIM